MELKQHCTKPTPTALFFLLFVFTIQHSSIHCQAWLGHISSSHSSSSSPTSKFSAGVFRRIVVSVVFGASAGLLFAILAAFLIRFFNHYLKQTPILRGPVVFTPKIDPAKLGAAMADQTHFLGSSPNGKYYKTVLDNGLVLAVKRLEPFESGSPEVQSKSIKRKMQQELEILANLSHRNLMCLRAYVREADRCSLVYDFMPAGSLEDAMNKVRNKELQLNWDVRLRIAVGVIKGLHYLHFTCVPQMLHYNLKPTNVMLDAEYEPRLADCGLAKALPHLHTTPSSYGAPECFRDCRYTEKSDVFSFGLILAVLLTGRDPKDPFFGEAANGGSLGKWLTHLQHAGEAREALDKSILGEEVEEDEMLMAVRISVKCCSDLPEDRPWSDELVNMLTQLHSF
uniref:Protein kinase domain-containing protein n=1 Tax=Kalanchoe fedtschenkoi TaxID=63787 RepID=A0A7N0SVR9_KALFE